MYCKTCKFWLFIDSTIGETDDQSIWGVCQRFPPTLPVEKNDFGIKINSQPVTDGVTSCGEYIENSHNLRREVMNIRVTEHKNEFFVDVEVEKGAWKNIYVAKTREEALDIKAKWLMGLFNG